MPMDSGLDNSPQSVSLLTVENLRDSLPLWWMWIAAVAVALTDFPITAF